MKIIQIIKYLIRLGMLVGAPLVIAAALTSTFQDPTPLIYDQFGWLLFGMALIYVLTGLTIKELRHTFAWQLIITGTILGITGAAFGIIFNREPLDERLPDNLTYYKFVRVKEVYADDDWLNPTGYEFNDTPFTKMEMDTLRRILEEDHKHYLISQDSSILILKTKLYSCREMSYINSRLEHRLQNNTTP